MTRIFIALQSLLLASSLVAVGCGDDDPPPADSGPIGDTGTADTSTPDSSGPGTTQTMRARYLHADDTPVEGVMLAIDTDLGRFEGVSDAAGELVLEYRYMTDSTDLIAALEGYRILAIVDAPYEAPNAADGFREVTMIELAPDLGDTVRLFANATGVPTGGRWCVAMLAYYTPCQDEGVTWDNRVGVRQFEDTIQDYVYGYALDDTGALVDFGRADWTVMPDGGRTVTLAFDGTLDETPTERDVTLNLPSDTESSFRTETLDESWQGWIVAVEPGTHLSRSALTTTSVGTDAITTTIHYFPVTDDELVWALAPTINPAESVRTFHWFSSTPADAPLDFLDVARMRSGAVLTDEFEWTVPATDVDRYLLRLMNAAGIVAIGLGTTNAFATVPALPSGYDTSVSFPFPGAPGLAQVIALRGEGPPDEMATDPYRVDADASTSLRHPFTF